MLLALDEAAAWAGGRMANKLHGARSALEGGVPHVVIGDARGERPVARALARLVRIWTPFMHRIFTGIGGTLAEDNAAFLHDPLTALSLVDESALRFERLRVLPTIERGVLRTLEMPQGSGLGAEMEVATGVDARPAAEGVLERLLHH